MRRSSVLMIVEILVLKCTAAEVSGHFHYLVLREVKFESSAHFCHCETRIEISLDKMDEGTKTTVSKLPLLTVRASPRDKEAWTARLKEELTALIQVRKQHFSILESLLLLALSNSFVLFLRSLLIPTTR